MILMCSENKGKILVLVFFLLIILLIVILCVAD